MLATSHRMSTLALRSLEEGQHKKSESELRIALVGGTDLQETLDSGAQSARYGHLGQALHFVRSLALGVANGTEPLPQAVYDALRSIEEKVQSIQAAIAADHVEDQLVVDNARDEILDCDDLAKLDNASAVMTVGKEKEHSSCRGSEAQLSRAATTACAEHMEVVSKPNPPECMPTFPFKPQQKDVAEMLLCTQSIALWSVEFNATAARTMALCNDASATHASKVQHCGKAQASYEAAFCSHHVELAGVCSAYSTCRSSRLDKRQKGHALVKAAESNRRKEHAAVEHIQCYLKVLNATSGKQQVYDECSSLLVTASHLDVRYHAVPEGVGCVPETTYPCQESWLEKHYKNRTWYADAPTTACSPCTVAEPTSTGEPTSIADPTTSTTTSAEPTTTPPTMCSGHICGEGMVIHPNADSMPGSDDNTCCLVSTGSEWLRAGKVSYLAVPLKKTWPDALAHCQGLGSNITLASIQSQAQQNVLAVLTAALDATERFWIGASDIARDGTWVWTDGTVLDYANWNTNEPNGGSHENCALLLRGDFTGSAEIKRRKWNDAKCTIPKFFLCMYSTIPE